LPDQPLRDLDRIDRQLLRALQADGRAPLTQLAREVHLSVTPCTERVRRLESQGYIRGYYAQLDPDKLGRSLLAYIQVQLDRTTPDVFERFKQAALGSEEIMECQMVAGGFDYLVKVRVRDMAAYRKFLGERIACIRGVMQTHTYFVMEEVKSMHVLPVGD
jgi:Lrp/AsnC family transcriptional regulator, leucine-responsive regulatory protein